MSKDHIHKYYKGTFPKSGAIIYRCRLSNCSHYVHETMIIGRLSICWRCGEIFEIMRKTLRSKKLHCENCTRGKYNKVIERPIIDNKAVDNITEVLKILDSFNDSIIGE